MILQVNGHQRQLVGAWGWQRFVWICHSSVKKRVPGLCASWKGSICLFAAKTCLLRLNQECMSVMLLGVRDGGSHQDISCIASHCIWISQIQQIRQYQMQRKTWQGWGWFHVTYKDWSSLQIGKSSCLCCLSTSVYHWCTLFCCRNQKQSQHIVWSIHHLMLYNPRVLSCT